jgi:membrane protease YdiL (CAAX protease family)
MRERFTRGDLRFLAACAVVLFATIWFSAKFFYHAFPEASIDFRVTRDESGVLGERFLQEQGLSVAGYREASRFSYDDNAKTFLEREAGLERANELMASRVRLWRWSHRWFRPGQIEEYRVDITPRGDVAGFEHRIPETAPGASLSSTDARAAAESFLRGKMGRDPASLEFVEASIVERPARTDHTFTWKERRFSIHDADYRIEVSVLGDRIGSYREYLKVPDAWQRGYARLRSANDAASQVDVAVMLLLALGLVAVILMRVRRHDVRWKRASFVGLAGAVLSFFSSWNSQPLAFFDYPTQNSYASFTALLLLRDLAQACAAGALLFILTAGAEPLYREHFAGRVSLGNLFRPRGMRTKSFLIGSALGITLAGVFVAYQTGFYLIGSRFGAWSPAEVPYDDLLNTRFPWMFVLFGGFFPAVSEEFLFRMFAIPFLRRLLRWMPAAVVLAAFIWGFGHAAYPQQPFWIRGVEVGMGGVLLGWVVLRWGILPALVWHYSVDAMYSSMLLLRSHNTYFMLSGAASAGIVLLPLAFAVFMYVRKRGFEPEAGLTNGDEGTAPPPEAETRPASAPVESAYVAWSTRRRAAAVALALAAGAFLFVPVERFGEKPGFALTAAQARAAGDTFVRSLGLDPGAFRAVAYPESAFNDATARYFLERRPVSYLANAYSRIAPARRWNVRYFKASEKEEVRVALDPESGKPLAFVHTMPDDQPGADLPAADAQKIAADYLASRSFDLSTLELKESSSEKKKARRDYTMIWEARPGDPRNLDDARYRVQVEVNGDQPSVLRTSWKLPETFLREQSRITAFSIALLVLRIAFWGAAVVFGLLLLVRRTRKGEVRWRPAWMLAAPLAVLALAGAASTYQMLYQNYDTAIPFATFQAILAVTAGMGVVITFVTVLLAAALLFALWPLSLDAFRSDSRRRTAVDAILALLLAAAFAGFAAEFENLLRARFHSVAVYGVSVPQFLGGAAPALAALAGAAVRSVELLAVAGLAVYAWNAARGWRRYALALAALAAVVPMQVQSAGEFALGYAVLLVTAALAWVFAAWFARGNYLAYALAVFGLSLGSAALELIGQPSAYFEHQGWLLAGVSLAALAWTAYPAFIEAGDRGAAVAENQ